MLQFSGVLVSLVVCEKVLEQNCHCNVTSLHFLMQFSDKSTSAYLSTSNLLEMFKPSISTWFFPCFNLSIHEKLWIQELHHFPKTKQKVLFWHFQVEKMHLYLGHGAKIPPLDGRESFGVTQVTAHHFKFNEVCTCSNEVYICTSEVCTCSTGCIHAVLEVCTSLTGECMHPVTVCMLQCMPELTKRSIPGKLCKLAKLE